MAKALGKPQRRSEAALLESRLAHHLGCLREDPADPVMTTLERLAVVRDRVKRIREIRQELECAKPESNT